MPDGWLAERTDVATPGDAEGAPQRELQVAAAVAGLIAGWVAFRHRDLPLLGFDTHPIIAASRVRSWADLTGTFSEKLMDGRFQGEFYRPVLNASIALDEALFGLEPFGYHLTNALIYGCAGFALFGLARAVVGRGRLAPWMVLLFFFAHPSAAEVVPLPERRPELLVVLLLGCSLWAQTTRRPRWMVATLTMLAVASKETAVIAPALGAALSVPAARRDGWPFEARSLLGGALPHLIGVGIVAGARFAVLGGLGGHGFENTPALERLGLPFGRMWLDMVEPRALRSSFWLPAAAATALLAAIPCAAAARSRARAPLRLAILGSVWVGAVSGVYAAAGSLQPWYRLIPAAGASLIFGACAQLAASARRDGRRTRRAAAALVAVCLGFIAIAQTAWSPWVRELPNHRRAARAAAAFFEELEAAIVASPLGTSISAPPLPLWSHAHVGEPPLYPVSVLSAQSVQAWADLAYPEHSVRVATRIPAASTEAGPDERVVVLGRLKSGFFRAPHRGSGAVIP